MGHPHIVKTCAECKALKPVGDFYRSAQAKTRRDSYCKACRRSRDRARSANKKALYSRKKEADPFHLRRWKLVRLYGITHDQYMEMHAAQGGVCAICKKPERRILYGDICLLSVDHSHSTGRVRALLCHRCNTALGYFEDADFVSKATAYLLEHQ